MVDSIRTLGLDDNRWNHLTGGYRTKCDPRPLLAQLESEQNKERAWHRLWEELHHQGDVGEASYICAASREDSSSERHRGK